MKEILALLGRDIQMELRQKYSIHGILLYVAGTLYIIQLSFQHIEPLTWITLLWISLLFSAINACQRGFANTASGENIFYYQLCHPANFLLSKYIFNFLLVSILCFLTVLGFIIFFGSVIADYGFLSLIMLLGALGLSVNLTMTNAIASKGKGSGSLMSVLSFPVLIPQLMLLIRLTKQAMDGLSLSVGTKFIWQLIAIDAVVVVVSLLLFPYLWRD